MLMTERFHYNICIHGCNVILLHSPQLPHFAPIFLSYLVTFLLLSNVSYIFISLCYFYSAIHTTLMRESILQLSFVWLLSHYIICSSFYFCENLIISLFFCSWATLNCVYTPQFLCYWSVEYIIKFFNLYFEVLILLHYFPFTFFFSNSFIHVHALSESHDFFYPLLLVI